MVMIQILSGMIIDNFSSLREREANRLTDMAEVCFICGENK
jgi:hypothetical protein